MVEAKGSNGMKGRGEEERKVRGRRRKDPGTYTFSRLLDRVFSRGSRFDFFNSSVLIYRVKRLEIHRLLSLGLSLSLLFSGTRSQGLSRSWSDRRNLGKMGSL